MARRYTAIADVSHIPDCMEFSGVLFCPRHMGLFLQQVQALQRDVEDSQAANAQLEAHSTEMQQKVYKSSDRQHVCLETTQLVVI